MAGTSPESGRGARFQFRLERAPRLPRPGFGPALVIALFGLLVIGFEFLQLALPAPAPGETRTLCMLRSTTGVPCPGCGSTRAVKAAASLEPLAALRANPLIITLLGGTLLVLGLRFLTGRAIRCVLPTSGWTIIAIVFVLLLLLNWWWVLRQHGFLTG